MNRNVFLGTLCSAAFAVSVAAQTGSPATPQADQQSSKQQQVTVVGCLNSADVAGTAGTGTAGAAGQKAEAPKSEGQFVLTNARVTAGAAGTSGTTGTGTAASPTSANRFLLIGGSQADLKKYLNSEVEIRGTLQPRTGADRPAAGTGTGTGSAPKSTQGEMNANLQRLRVTSVKQTAQTCSGGN